MPDVVHVIPCPATALSCYSTGVQDVATQLCRATERPQVSSTAPSGKSRRLWYAVQVPNKLGGSYQKYTALQLRVNFPLHHKLH